MRNHQKRQGIGNEKRLWQRNKKNSGEAVIPGLGMGIGRKSAERRSGICFWSFA
jgi:hypothetical protein